MKKSKKWKKLLTMVLAFCLVLPGILKCLPVLASKEGDESLTIQSETITGAANYFKFFGSGWVGGGGEYYNNVSNGDASAATKYYEIYFIGNGITIYGAKDPKHGKLMASVDGGAETVVDTYSPSRTSVMPIYAVENLSEGPHTIKVAATGQNVAGQPAVAQVNKAVITHKPYVAEKFTVAQQQITIAAGESKNALIQYTPDYASLSDLTLTSDNPAVVSVEKGNILAGNQAGTAVVTVSSQTTGQTDTIEVTVTQSSRSLTGTIVDTDLHYSQERYQEVVNGAKTNTKSLYSWKNDKAVSEIVLASIDGGFNRVTAAAGDFVSDSGTIPAGFIHTTFLKETKGYTDYGNQPDNGTNKKSVPDVLYSEESARMAPNTLQPIWVEIQVPEETPAGIYHGIITVQADGSAGMNFEYDLEVLDVSMPAPSEYQFDVEYWQYPYTIAEYYNLEPFSEKHLEVLRKHMGKYKELGGHAITASIVEEAWGGQTYSANEVHYPSMVKWIRKADGSFVYDYTHFDAWIHLNKEMGMGDKIVCYSMIPWGNQIRYYDEAAGSWQTMAAAPLDAGYGDVWTPFLKSLIAHVDEKGWFEDTYIGIDERPNMEKAFDVIEKVLNKDGKSLKISAAIDHFNTSKELTDRVAYMSVGSTAAKDSLASFDAFVARRNSLNKDYKTSIYTCVGHFPNSFTLSMPCESYWTMMFTAAQGCTGFMRWAFDAWVADPLRDTSHVTFEAGDCFLIYPDEKDAENPVSKSSVRLEKMDEGVRDVNKLYLMREKYPALKKDVAALFTSIKPVIKPDGTMDMYTSSGRYASNESKIAIPADMKQVKNTIYTISQKYAALNSLAEAVENAEGLVLEDYTFGSFERLQAALESGREKLKMVSVSTDEIQQTVTAIAEAEAGLVLRCTCSLTNLNFSVSKIILAAGESSKDINLGASAKKAGSCRIKEHEGKSVTYSYEIVEDKGKIAKLSGSRLTLSEAGNVTVKVTASLAGTNALPLSQTAVFVAERASLVKPAAPSGFKVSRNRTDRISLSWKKVKGASGYILERRAESSKKWKEVKKTTSASITNSGLKAGTVYVYRVKAYIKQGNQIKEGNYSKQVTTATAPKKPEMKVKQAGKGKVKLTWSKKTYADQFYISIKTGNGKYRSQVVKNSKATSLMKTKLKKGTTYTFKIKGIKKLKSGDISSYYSKEKKILIK